MGLRFLLFILFPLLELWLLLKVGALIGAVAVLALVVLSALIGTRVLQLAGWRTWLGSRWRLQQGQSPAPELVDGFLLAIGGMLLLLPGLISDAIGLLLLISPLRRYFASRFFRASPTVTSAGTSQSAPLTVRGDTIEGEFRREP
ncbi:MAG TPA: FxsA family protein [Spongiibacteraceae bacterium]